MALGLRARANLGIGIVFGLLLAIGWASARSIRRLDRSQALVLHTQDVHTTIRDVHALLADAESGQRGFLLTGSTDYLVPLDLARDRIAGRLATLRELTRDQPDQLRRLDLVAPLIRARLARLDSVAGLRRSGGLSREPAAVGRTMGRALMDSIRTLLAQMEDEEVASLEPRMDAARSSARLARLVMALGVLGAALITMVGGYFLHRDIGRRLALEVRTRDSEAHLRAIFDTVTDGIVVTDASGAIQDLNPAAARIFGWSEAELRGLNIATLMPEQFDPEPRPGAAPLRPGASVLGRPAELEWRRRDGTAFPAEFTFDQVRLGRTESLFVGVIRDLTERRRLEAASEAADLRYQSAVGVMAEGIVVQDAAGRVVDCNQAAELILGQARERILDPSGGAWWMTGVREDGSGFAADDHPARLTLATGMPTRNVVMGLECRDRKTRWLLINAAPMRDRTARVTGVVTSFSDITRRKEAERNFKAARDAAEHANRAKSEFLANMSHELRTPLNSVIGFASVLLRNRAGTLESVELQYLKRIHDNGLHLLGLINGILDLSRVESGRVELELREVRLDQLVRETLAQLEGDIRDRPVALRTEVPPALAPMTADAVRLKQVLINLVANALKFTERGSVTVRIAAGAEGQPECLDVVDTGIGIPKDRQQAVFEAFQQADNSTARRYGGTGLGLTITRSLAQLMGYHLTVQSEVGVGSTFSVHFAPASAEAAGPAAAGAPAVPAPAPSPALPPGPRAGVPLPPRPGGRPLVLVIDDDPDARLLLAHFIEDFGYQAVVAGGGAQGLLLARTLRPALITLDIMMPEMNGIEVLDAMALEPELARIPVVIVSIVGSEQRDRALNAVAVMDKPVTREGLEAVLRRHLEPPRETVALRDELGRLVRRYAGGDAG